MAEMAEEGLEDLTQENPFMKKYLALRNKCEQLQQANEKLVNRLHHVKKMVRRYKHERRFLARRLEEHSDRYQEAQVPVMWEEDQLYSLLKPQPPVTSPSPLNQSATPKSKPVKKHKSGDLLAANSITPPQQSPDKSAARMQSSLLLDVGQLGLIPAKKIKKEKEDVGQLGLIPAKKIKKEKEDVGQLGLIPAKKIKKEKETPPRKPTNAFVMFCDQYRQAIQEEYVRVYYDMFEIQKRQYDREQREQSAPTSQYPPEAQHFPPDVGQLVPTDLSFKSAAAAAISAAAAAIRFDQAQ